MNLTSHIAQAVASNEPSVKLKTDPSVVSNVRMLKDASHDDTSFSQNIINQNCEKEPTLQSERATAPPPADSQNL